MHSGSTYCVCHSRLLKHSLQGIKWDVKPLNPLSSLQVLSASWIVWCLYLPPRGTKGNEARGRRLCTRHLLSISWLNFHCYRETESLPPSSLQADAWRGSLLCEGNQWGSEGVKRGWGIEMERQELLELKSVWEVLWVVQAVAGGKRRRKRKSSLGKFFSLLSFAL